MAAGPFDVVIAGLGAAGSAAAWSLARRGARVLGLDLHHPPHERGSSHGRSRIFREAYFEHPLYVPLIRRALELWAALERDAGASLVRRTGALSIGAASGTLIRGTLASAREHGIAHEPLDAGAVRARFPGWQPPDDHVAVLEPGAGLLRPEAAIDALLNQAARAGARLGFRRPLLGWRADGESVMVDTADGRVSAGRLILAAGPWLPDLLPEPRPPLVVERQQVHWLAPRDGTQAFRVHRSPVGLWECEPGRVLYTIPDTGDGLKAAFHHGGQRTHPERVDRSPSAADERAVRAALARLMPAAEGRLLDASVCLYTNTPDDHFILDEHPSGALVASPCSGHGFKFAPAIGEILADLALTGRTAFDLAPFRLSRFDPTPPDPP